jgi:hypothetical protein
MTPPPPLGEGGTIHLLATMARDAGRSFWSDLTILNLRSPDRKRSSQPRPQSKGNNHQSKPVKAAEIFQDKAKDPEQQLYAIHRRVNDREMRIATFTKLQSEEISSKSKLARFKQRYKRFPALGMKVDVVTDDNSCWKIAL